jgi:branched-subunit amino acid aminotransferase/4-amino-4-deoxychorismate lyase
MQAWRWTSEGFTACTSVPIEDRGFRYGMALFESIRVLQGRALFFEEHLERLREACWQREFAVEETALQAVRPLLAALGGDIFARIYVTGGDGGPADPPSACRVYVIVEPRPWVSASAYRLALSPDLYGPLFGGLKTANYWLNIDALQRARRKGFDEALLFNENAELVSACMANVFVVHDGLVKTPCLACGARNGVVREWIIRTTGAREGSIFLNDVHTADEVFVANSWIGIVPAASVEERVIPARVVAEDLRGRFEAEIAGA